MFALAGAVAYFALARASFELLGHERVLGVEQGHAQAGLLIVAVALFVAIPSVVARRAGDRWALPTVATAAAAAGLGALAHTMSLGIQVRWGERCIGCRPVGFLVELTLASALAAAIGAPILGAIARRVRLPAAWRRGT